MNHGVAFGPRFLFSGQQRYACALDDRDGGVRRASPVYGRSRPRRGPQSTSRLKKSSAEAFAGGGFRTQRRQRTPITMAVEGFRNWTATMGAM